MLAGHGNWHMLEANEFVVSGIEAAPARAGKVDLGPGVGGAVLAFPHLDVARDKSRAKAQMPGSLHHEHRVVAAGSGAPRERLAGELKPGSSRWVYRKDS